MVCGAQDPLLDEQIRAVAAAMPQALPPASTVSPASDDSSASILAALHVASAASVAPLTVLAAQDDAQVPRFETWPCRCISAISTEA